MYIFIFFVILVISLTITSISEHHAKPSHKKLLEEISKLYNDLSYEQDEHKRNCILENIKTKKDYLNLK